MEGGFMTLSPYSIPNIIVGISFFLLGIFVFTKNPKGLTNRIFFLLACTSTLWQLMYALAYNLTDEAQAFFILRFGYVGVNFIAPTACHTAYLVCKADKKFKYYIIATYIIGVIFALLMLTTPLVISGAYKYFWGYYPKHGPLHPLFLTFFIGQINIVLTVYLYELIFKRKAMTQLQVTQMVVILVGYLIYTGACVDFLPNYHIAVYPFGYICAFFFISIVGFTIIRYRFLEIDTVIHKTILWLLSILFLIVPMAVMYQFAKYWLAGLTPITTISIICVSLLTFLWYYHRLKPRIDHFFRRRAYDYQAVLADLPSRIGTSLELSELSRSLFKELKEILYTRNGLLLVKPPDKEGFEEVASMGYDDPKLIVTKVKKVSLETDDPLVFWLSSNPKVLEKIQVETDPQYAVAKSCLLSFFGDYGLELVIPLTMDEQLISILGLGKKENLRAYRESDVALLEKLGKQIGISVDNALHHGDIVEKERLAEELRLGRQIQMMLLPQGAPLIPGLEVRGMMEPAKEIGGDYYDFIDIPHRGSTSVVIGDVSGKGVAAGLLMAMAKTAIHTLSQEETSPKQILLRANQILNKHISGQKFMTMLYFQWHAQSKTMIYSSAGHEHILIYRGRTRILETIQSGGMMLGMIPDIEMFLEERQLQLDSGDKILLYTDGVTEALDENQERFGLPRLKGLFEAHQAQPADELMKFIKDEVYAFMGNTPQYDDITLVVMEIL